MGAQPTIVVNLVYLARLREAFGVAAERLDVPVTQATAGGVRAFLAARGGPWAVELAAGRAVRVAVNHEVVDAAAPLRAGDEVALFPPVTGG